MGLTSPHIKSTTTTTTDCLRSPKSQNLDFLVETLAFELIHGKLSEHMIAFEHIQYLKLGRFLQSPGGDDAIDKLRADMTRIIKTYIRSAKL